MKLGGHLQGTEGQVPTKFGPNRHVGLGGGARGTRRVLLLPTVPKNAVTVANRSVFVNNFGSTGPISGKLRRMVGLDKGFPTLQTASFYLARFKSY